MDWDSTEIISILDRALEEDIGSGDITSNTLLERSPVLSAVFVAKQSGLLAGLPLVSRIFRLLDRRCKIEAYISDGKSLTRGMKICGLTGRASSLLAGERLALNFLQRLSGIATQTASYVRQARPYGIAVMDTRKTTPLLRKLEKYAVKIGGGVNHRYGLYDAILVKDNHLRLQPDFKRILRAFEDKGFSPDRVEIEVTSAKMLKEAIRAGARWLLLDNMTPAVIRKCILLKQPNMYFEVSGGITAANFSSYLIQGVDAISIGALTHSVRSLDISMEMETKG